MRRLALVVAVAGATLWPATAVYAHGGDTPRSTAYRTAITGISTPEKGLTIRTVEGGARLELTNRTGHSVEVLGYSGEPYLDIRPDGTYQNVNSPAAYRNQTLSGDTPVPASADPTAPPTWRRLSAATTVRWHDERTHWLSSGRPVPAVADPTRSHRLRDWVVPLRTQVRTFELRGTLDWEPPPRTGLWWAGSALTGAAMFVAARRRLRPVALITGLTPLLYAGTRLFDGGGVSFVPLLAGLLALAAAYRHPPFYLALSGAVVSLFAGFGQAGVFAAAVLPAWGPGWLSRAAVMVAIGGGAAMTVAGLRRLPGLSTGSAPARSALSTGSAPA